MEAAGKRTTGRGNGWNTQNHQRIGKFPPAWVKLLLWADFVGPAHFEKEVYVFFNLIITYNK